MRLICGVVQLDGALAEAGALSAMFAALTSPGQVPVPRFGSTGPQHWACWSSHDIPRLETRHRARFRKDRMAHGSPAICASTGLESWRKHSACRLERAWIS
jgi:hypothetical protein